MLNCFDRIEPRFKLILSEFFNFFPNLNFSKIHNIDYEIKIENIGQYNIFNIQKEREKNGFISEYDLNREGKNLFCVKRNEKGEKLTIQTKTEKILEGVNEMNNSMNWRKKLKETEYFSKKNDFIVQFYLINF